jgi:hypothetical protein
VALQDPEIGSTEHNIWIDNNCGDDELHFGMPGSSEHSDKEDENGDAIPTPSWRRLAATELERFDLGTRDIDKYGPRMVMMRMRMRRKKHRKAMVDQSRL